MSKSQSSVLLAGVVAVNTTWPMTFVRLLVLAWLLVVASYKIVLLLGVGACRALEERK